jgi:hypothetical protein
MFFSLCITSRLCASFRDDQYNKSHKLTLQLQHCPNSCFLFLLWDRGCFPGLTSLTFSSCYVSSSWVNHPGFSWFSIVPSKSDSFPLHGWSVDLMTMPSVIYLVLQSLWARILVTMHIGKMSFPDSPTQQVECWIIMYAPKNRNM